MRLWQSNRNCNRGNIDALAALGCQTIAHRCRVTRRKPSRISAIAELLSVVRDSLQKLLPDSQLAEGAGENAPVDGIRAISGAACTKAQRLPDKKETSNGVGNLVQRIGATSASPSVVVPAAPKVVATLCKLTTAALAETMRDPEGLPDGSLSRSTMRRRAAVARDAGAAGGRSTSEKIARRAP
jgi:hypothetical protein